MKFDKGILVISYACNILTWPRVEGECDAHFRNLPLNTSGGGVKGPAQGGARGLLSPLELLNVSFEL